MKIALDVMGGDHAPLSNIEGAFSYLEESSDDSVVIILVGDEPTIESIITDKFRPSSQIQIIHTTEVVTMNDRPSRILKTKPDSSLVRCIELVKSGDADCIISAGNTGALLSSSLFLLGKISGIRRPAFAPYIPTDSGGLILCDAGANADARPQHLVQFALMASAYLEHVDQIPNPRVGLLNIGTEENKGNELTRTAYSLLKDHVDNFIGNVESRYMLSGGVDVLICDGFTGNVALKLIEGIFKNVSRWLQSSVANTTGEDDSIILSILVDLKSKFDYEEYGGTPLLGINGIVMKCHGSSSKLSIRNTIQAVKKFHNENLIGDIADRLSKHMDIFDENTINSEAQTA